MRKRVDIRTILRDEHCRKELLVGSIQALQNLAGIDTTRAQAEAAYDRVNRRPIEQRPPAPPEL